jgi:hypothetical protein
MQHLTDAPTANILALAGIVFLAVGIFGHVGGYLGNILGAIEAGRNARVLSGLLGTVLLVGGVVMHYQADQARADSSDKDTCIQGYVWRGANPNDHVCVTPQIRAQTALDNSQATLRRDPGGGHYGPDSCVQGYVWREAFPGDHVCVTPATRAQAASDNREAPGRLAVSQ